MGLDNPIHIALLLLVLLLVFGAKRLPEMGRSLGSGLRGFKDSLSGLGELGELPQPVKASVVEASASASEPQAPAA